MVHHAPPLGTSLVIGRLIKDRVTKCFLSIFRVVEWVSRYSGNVEKCEEMKQRTSTHTGERYTGSALSGFRLALVSCVRSAIVD